jgi:hypothetical protein
MAAEARLESVSRRRANGLANQRGSVRRLVVAPCVVYFRERRHVGLIRDISSGGLFAYSNFQPLLGDTLRIVITQRDDFASATVTCQGEVVRVESRPEGAATGIALKVSCYELVQPDAATQIPHAG